MGTDDKGYRREFIGLVHTARSLYPGKQAVRGVSDSPEEGAAGENPESGSDDGHLE